MSEAYHETTLDAALRYADLGWSVFPTLGATDSDKAKLPAVKEVGSWRENSTTDAKQIAAWFAGTGYGVGVDCGKSNIVALDADRLELVPNGLPLGNAWALRGNPQRMSFIFDQPPLTAIGCARGQWAAGEVKGVGGYVCLPPSYHVIGGQYVWVSTIGSREMPLEVQRLLKPPTSKETGNACLTSGEMCRVVSRALSSRLSLLANVKEGRYELMVKGVYELGALGAEGHSGTREAVKALGEAYLVAVSDTRPTEARGEVYRAVKGLEGGIQGVSPQECLGTQCEAKGVGEASTGVSDDFEEKVLKRIESLKVTREAKQRLAVEDAGLWVPPVASTLLELEIDSSEPERIQGLLSANGLALLVAQRKTGKTTVVSNVVKCLVEGGKLFGEHAARKEEGVVGLLDLEMTTGLLGKTYARLGIQGVSERLKIYALRGNVGNSLSVLRDRPEAFGEWLRGEGITTLIIDPLAPLLVVLGVDEIDNTGIRKMFDTLREVASEAGVREIVVSHHAGWGDNGRSRGASAFEDAPDVIWRLRKDEAGLRLFSVIGRTQEFSNRELCCREGLLTYGEEFDEL